MAGKQKKTKGQKISETKKQKAAIQRHAAKQVSKKEEKKTKEIAKKTIPTATQLSGVVISPNKKKSSYYGERF